MPNVLSKGQYRFAFYASDEDEPPHVHIRHERRTAKFWIDPMIRLEKNNGFRPHEINEIARIIQENKEHLMEAWNAFFPTSPVDLESELEVRPTAAAVTDDTLTVELEDGRTVSVPTAWYPRLQNGTTTERDNYELSTDALHWPDLDEDISVPGLLLGRKSGENPKSIQWWLKQRAKGRKTTFEDYFNEVVKGQGAKKSRPKGRQRGS